MAVRTGKSIRCDDTSIITSQLHQALERMQRQVEDIQQEIDRIRGRADYLDRDVLIQRVDKLENILQGISLFEIFLSILSPSLFHFVAILLRRNRPSSR